MSDVRLRPLAEADLVERSRHYRSEGGDDLGARFFAAAIESLRMIERVPGAWSLRIGELAEVPGLRSYRLAGFRCGWFYFDRLDHVDVVRLLSYAQDVVAILGDLDENG